MQLAVPKSGKIGAIVLDFRVLRRFADICGRFAVFLWTICGFQISPIGRSKRVPNAPNSEFSDFNALVWFRPANIGKLS